MKILVLNPGSTSTKVAVYSDKQEICKRTLAHTREELAKYPAIMDQLDFRYGLVMAFLEETGCSPDTLDCVMSRGGSPPGVMSGATVIDKNLVDALRFRPKEPHPASVGPIIAARIAEAAGIPAYIYDPITADELNPLARVFGVKGIDHDSMCHVLNSRAMAIATAKELGRQFTEMSFIVAHFGGGNSVSCWHKGLLHDVVPGDAGAFSAERCGFIRGEKLLNLTKDYDYKTISGWFHGKGGMVSLLGTNDLREVEKMVDDGHGQATLYMQAMAYQLSRSIASLLPTINGKADGIVLTGGGAHWEKLTDEIKARLAFLNIPVFVRPGENEMQSLAEGAVRVMRGEETAHIYEG